ncbi:hypothetical protein R6Q59_015861 [Mikania micrantha]
MSGSRNARGRRGSRGHVPHPSDRSGTRQSTNSSPVSGDNTSLRKYTCGRHTIFRGGHTGPSNSSHTGRADPMVETQGFASFTVHHTICTILREHLTEPWITFRKVPQEVRRSMYDRFKTRWSWNPECEQNTYEGFINVLKSRYSDIMYNLKLQSTNKAMEAGFEIGERDYTRFSIIRNYPPDSIPDGVWSQMCDLWDTDAWRKKSESAKRNRSSVSGSDKSSRHTAGSIGYDEYRVRLRKIMRKEPNYKDIFLMTHLNKDSKAKFLAGELSINSLDEMDFCTNRARVAYSSYLEEMMEKYGPEFKDDDPDVWGHVVNAEGRAKRIYGIGSSDVDYVVTGKASTSSGIVQSDHDQRLSQEKVCSLFTTLHLLIHNLEVQMEVERKAREELQEQIRQERQEMQNQMNEAIKKGIEEFMRSLHPGDVVREERSLSSSEIEEKRSSERIGEWKKSLAKVSLMELAKPIRNFSVLDWFSLLKIYIMWKKSRAKVSQMESGDVLIIGAMLLISVQSSYSIYQSRRWSKRRQGETGYSKKSGFHLTIPVKLGYCFELPDCSVLLRHFVLHLTSLPQAVKKEVKVKTKVEMWYSKTSCFHLTIPIKEVKEVKTKTKAETGYSKTSYSHLTCLMKGMIMLAIVAKGK